MTQASKKFQQLKRKIHAWKASDRLKSSLFDNVNKQAYPNCIGFFDDCPPQINDPNNPPDQCKTCPKYRESKYFRPKKREIPEFLRKKIERIHERRMHI
ncbi:MAG: hypothetical protein J7J92_01065 [Candidatus Aenigmarchaeota archaeon]|nr:hypothetical protein [Candidatus Aenigmarchaeota archaeon]